MVDCATERFCYLRNLHDKMDDGKTAFENKYGKTFDGPSFPFGTLVEYIPITAKDKSRILQFWLKTLWRFSGCMGVGQVTWWVQILKICKNQKPQKSTSKDSKNMGYSWKKITNFRVQTELQDFLVVQDHHRQQRETPSRKMVLKSKKATKREGNKRCVVHVYPTYNASWRIQVGTWRTYENPKDYQTRQCLGLKLGHNFPRNKNKHKFESGQKDVPNCKQHAATEESTRYSPMTKITSRWLLMLVWNWKRIIYFAVPCIVREESRGKPQTCTNLPMPVRNSQI